MRQNSAPTLGHLGSNSTAGLIRRLRDLGVDIPPGAGPTQLRQLLEDHENEDTAPRQHPPRQGWQLEKLLENRQTAHPRSPSSPSRPRFGTAPATGDLNGRLSELGYDIPSNVLDRGDLEKVVEEAERQRHGHRLQPSLKLDLPPDWQQQESRSKPGRFYFMNRVTGERTWEPWFQQESRTTPGRFYYINVLTGHSAWVPPTRRWKELTQERLLQQALRIEPPPLEAPAEEDLPVEEVDPPAPDAADYRDCAFADGVTHEDELPAPRKLSTASVLSCTHGSRGVRKLSVTDAWVPPSEPLVEDTPEARPVYGQELKWLRGPLIGRGSLGRVFRAMELETTVRVLTGRILAVKEVPINTLDRRDEQFKESLENEVNIMKALKHEHIVEYLGHDYMDSCLYLYLEHVPGGSITQALNDFGAFVESLMASYAKQTLAGLEYLHSREPAVIHRDIKGSNILIGDGDIVKLADFGCSKRTDETLTHTIRGSIPWMAPEVLAHARYGRAADLWSFGCVVIEMGTANVPWGRFEHHMAALVKIGLSQETPPLPEQVSEACQDTQTVRSPFAAHSGRPDFLQRCVCRTPEDRWSAAELLQHHWFQLELDTWDD